MAYLLSISGSRKYSLATMAGLVTNLLVSSCPFGLVLGNQLLDGLLFFSLTPILSARTSLSLPGEFPSSAYSQQHPAVFHLVSSYMGWEEVILLL